MPTILQIQFKAVFPFDLAEYSADAGQTLNVNSGTFRRGVYVSPDGTQLFVTDRTNSEFVSIPLSTPFDLTTAGSAVTGGTTIVEPAGIFIKPDGTKAYISQRAGPRAIHQYTMSTPWDVTTMSYDNVSVTPDNIGTFSSNDLSFSNDGTKLYIALDSGNQGRLQEFSLGTPWNLSTATYSNQFTDPSVDVEGVAVTSSGQHLIIGTDFPGERFYELELGTALDISTAVAPTTFISALTGAGMFITPDDQYIFSIRSNGTITRYSTA
jgi:DNA-binding beta-propeller fold protein YncE